MSTATESKKPGTVGTDTGHSPKATAYLALAIWLSSNACAVALWIELWRARA
jgi:hypothetical protein